MRAVCKLAAGLYTPDRTTWVKVKNRAYSQAEGRADFFNGRVSPCGTDHLTGRTDLDVAISNECGRLIANVVHPTLRKTL